jgi:hypothetical protein
MTRYEARLIAEELSKIIGYDYNKETYLTCEELADKLKLSVSYIQHNSRSLSRVKIGGATRYPLNKIMRKLEMI